MSTDEAQLRVELEQKIRTETEQRLRQQARSELVDDSARFLAEAAALVKADQPEKQTPFAIFWNTPSTAALVTVLLGGILGALLNHWIQLETRAREVIAANDARERELQHDIVSAVNTAKLEIHKATMADQAQSAREAFDLVGAIVGRSEDYIISLSPAYGMPAGASQKEQQVRVKLDTEREDLRQKFNEEQSRWAAKYVGAGMLLESSYNNDADVAQAWSDVASAVNDYRKFAAHIHPPDYAPPEWEKRFWAKYELAVNEKVGILKAKLHTARSAGLHDLVDVPAINSLLGELHSVTSAPDGASQ